MRHALRTALATAVVAGVALTPVVAATTALAAPHSAASSSATADRYSGTPVYIGKGYVAVLRNHSSDGGPEAWIRAVGPNWKPGDDYMVKVVAELDRTKLSAVVDGISLYLERGGDVPQLVVSGKGSINTRVAFPQRVYDGQDPAKPVRTVALKDGLTAQVYHSGDQHRYYTATVLKGAKELGELKAGGGYGTKDVQVFAGVQVTLTSDGDVTSVRDWGSDGQGESNDDGRLIRTQLLLGGLKGKVYAHGEGKTVYYTAHILEKDGDQLGVLRAGHRQATTHQMVYKLANGDRVRVILDSYGELTASWVSHGGQSTDGTGTDSTAKTGTGTPAPAPAAQTGATGVQIVPKGAVAAGAEVEDGGKDGHTVLVASGAGLASAGAAGLGFVALRRRAGARG
ncbi:hypothetical protein AB0G73_25340 [Streptomyces sp. NPDC020719]|uniref:hypothetical protein n=1 Tax=Streptomyces sp. NPDC020719 TaxID=3154896 RepID=UPI0033E0FCD0